MLSDIISTVFCSFTSKKTREKQMRFCVLGLFIDLQVENYRKPARKENEILQIRSFEEAHSIWFDYTIVYWTILMCIIYTDWSSGNFFSFKCSVISSFLFRCCFVFFSLILSVSFCPFAYTWALMSFVHAHDRVTKEIGINLSWLCLLYCFYFGFV